VLYVAFALGMGLVVISLSIAVSLAQHSFVRNMKRVLPHIQRISAVVLIIAGIYVSYYGWYEQRLLNASGSVRGGWLASLVSSVSDRLQSAVAAVDHLLLAAVVLLIAVAAGAFAVHRKVAPPSDR
jgi:hypothetical protein